MHNNIMKIASVMSYMTWWKMDSYSSKDIGILCYQSVRPKLWQMPKKVLY